jgi:hypothetical protein
MKKTTDILFGPKSTDVSLLICYLYVCTGFVEEMFLIVYSKPSI